MLLAQTEVQRGARQYMSPQSTCRQKPVWCEAFYPVITACFVPQPHYLCCGIKEEADSINQDKFQNQEFPAAAKRKLGKAIRTMLDQFCSGSCVGHASLTLIRQLAFPV